MKAHRRDLNHKNRSLLENLLFSNHGGWRDQGKVGHPSGSVPSGSNLFLPCNLRDVYLFRPLTPNKRNVSQRPSALPSKAVVFWGVPFVFWDISINMGKCQP